MWWRVVRICSYVICGTIIVACVVSYWFDVYITFQVFKGHWFMFGSIHGHTGIAWLVHEYGFFDTDKWIGTQFGLTHQDIRLASPAPWLPRITHRLIEGFYPPYYWVLSSSVTFPISASLIGLAWTYWLGRRARPRPGRCICGYDLRGNPAATACPECGARNISSEAASKASG